MKDGGLLKFDKPGSCKEVSLLGTLVNLFLEIHLLMQIYQKDSISCLSHSKCKYLHGQ